MAHEQNVRRGNLQ